VTDVIADLAIDFLKTRPREKPFFLMLHNKAPHRPWEPDATHRAQFADRWIPEPEHSGTRTRRAPTRFTRTCSASRLT
jgi:hypothetical protein